MLSVSRDIGKLAKYSCAQIVKARYNVRMPQQLWSWMATQFEKLETDSGVRTNRANEQWHVEIKKPHHAWGYRIALPEDAKMFLMWQSTIEVVEIKGDIMPGIAYFFDTHGVSFQLDLPNNCVEIRHALPEMKTSRVAAFPLRGQLEAPFKMKIMLNVLTKVCAGLINDVRLFSVKLPFKSLPSFDEITDLEILTTTQPNGAGGSVVYGELTLSCE